ncbi:PTS transporter subunit EIIB, partial [Mesobacillus selenatarsenatis]
MRNEERLAREILAQLGGADNIADVASCMTRLRVKPADYSKVNLDGIKKVDGVLGVVEAETLQIILGPGIVTKVANEVSEITGKTASSVDESDPDPFEGLAGRTKDELNKKNATPFKLFLRRIASIFIPLIPAIVASGLIAGLTNVIIRSGADPESTLIQFLNLIGWGIFSYLGVFVGINTAR